MTDPARLDALAPAFVPLMTGGLSSYAYLRKFTFRSAAWSSLAGAAVGGAAASVVTAGLGQGSQAVIAGVGGAAAGLTASRGLSASEDEEVIRQGQAAGGARRCLSPGKHRAGARGVLPPFVAALAALGLGWTGMGLAAVCLLLLLAAVGLMGRGWSVSAGLLTLASVLTAWLVVLGDLVLTRFAIVGNQMATVAVAVVALVPFMTRLSERSTWVAAARRLGPGDLAAVAIAWITARTWISMFSGLTDSQAISQLQRLGVDNSGHMLMLMSTSASGTALGGSRASLDINSGQAGYFHGGSLVQASIGSLLPAMSTPRLYLVSTGILMALLAGGIVAAATSLTSRRSTLAALAALAVGVLSVRLTWAMYEPGFPGHLLAACWLVAALTMMLLFNARGTRVWQTAALLLLFTVATWKTWNLAAPIFLLALIVVAARAMSGATRRIQLLLLCTALASFSLTALTLATRGMLGVDTLNRLTADGLVYRGVPFWFALALCLGLPLAYRLSGRREPPGAAALVWGSAGSMVGLMCWTLLHLGRVNYYTYKLEYLVLAVGLSCAGVALALVLGTWESSMSSRVRIIAAGCALAAAVPLLNWPGPNYHGWLAGRSALGPDPVMTCAIEIARQHRGSILLATGMGKFPADSLVTRAMDVGARNNSSAPLWLPIVFDDPARWPWGSVRRPVVLVEGPRATEEATSRIVSAASAHRVSISVSTPSCGREG